MSAFDFSSFGSFLSVIWFFIYWILGGVFFAVIALLRLGRVRKVRFSCLFTIWVGVISVLVSSKGLAWSHEAITRCVEGATSRVQIIVAVFTCGFSGVLGAFLIGAFAVTAGGFLIFAISRTKMKPWIVLEEEEVAPIKQDDSTKFFKG
ncbi:hypothetical protein HZA85_02335 [Candidatus Uhrbacteria bacterium]|nr:hypothetical protein [Candidatus Uhrbacteria bacterium]